MYTLTSALQTHSEQNKKLSNKQTDKQKIG